jgi:Na+/phosphate symporter
MSDAERRELVDLHDHVAEYFGIVFAMVESGQADISVARAEGDTITYLMKEYRSNHLDRMGNQGVGPFESLIITDMLNTYRRIKEHGLNIAETLAGV